MVRSESVEILHHKTVTVEAALLQACGLAGPEELLLQVLMEAG
jgi:hypothetical protein